MKAPTMARPVGLADVEKNEWFDNHLPYRLRVLMSWPDRLAQGDKYHGDLLNAGFEASLITCRLFLQFIGLGIDHGPLRLANRRAYFDKGPVDEVKVIDLGGEFPDAASLPLADAGLLARAYHAGSKASAHLTFNSGHGFDPARLPDACRLVLDLVRRHLYDKVNRPLPEIAFARLTVCGC